MAKIQELSQISLGPLTFAGPIKVRISGRFIPAFTIDISKKPTTAEKVGILNILNPKVQLLLGNMAYEMDYATRELKPIDPRIFEKDTLIDSIAKFGIIPSILLSALTIYGIIKLIRR